MFWLGAASALILMAGLYGWFRWRNLRKKEEPTVSPFSQQHFEHFQGEELDSSLLERHLADLRSALSNHTPQNIAERTRLDLEFLYRVEALASLGTEQAAQVLYHLAERKLGSDPMEKAWVLHDLIRALKALHCGDALQMLMSQATSLSRDNPLVYYCAVEIIAFPGFGRVLLGRPNDRDRRMGWQILRLALDGFRFGVHSRLLADCRLGDLLENLLDQPGIPDDPDFLIATAAAARLARRTPLLRRQLEGDSNDVEALSWQMAKIDAVEQTLELESPRIRKHLVRLALSRDEFAREKALRAIAELRIDTGNELLGLLKDPTPGDLHLIFEALGHAKGDKVLSQLLGFLTQSQVLSKAGWREAGKDQQNDSNARDAICAILEILKRHPGKQAETILIACCSLRNPKIRKAAISSLGWWEPLDRPGVLSLLKRSVSDSKPEVRWAAKAALARLGERKSLNFLRQLLFSEDLSKVHLGIQTVGNEGISLLWPDLDQLMDSEEEDISYHAWEATEKLGSHSRNDRLDRS